MGGIEANGEGRRDEEIGRILAACCPEETAVRDVVRLVLEATFAGTRCPPLPKVPKLFLTNHQISVDLLYLSSWLLGVLGERCVTVAWDGLGATQAGDLVSRLAARPGDAGAAEWLRPVLLDTRDPRALITFFETLGAERVPPNVIVATEGLRQYEDGQPVARVGTAFLDGAIARGMPVVPVRFAWAVPDRSLGRRFAWPFRMAPMAILVGEAIAPETLAGMPLPQRRDLVAGAMNRLFRPAPEGHRDLNAVMDRRIRSVMALSGISETKALLADLLVTADPARLTAEGRTLRGLLVDPSSWAVAEPGWLSDFASHVSDGGVTLYPFMHRIYGEAWGPARAEAWR